MTFFTKPKYILHIIVLLNLCERYETNKVYTRAGTTLLAVNPFCDISGLYGQEIMANYGLAYKNTVGNEKVGILCGLPV